MAALRAGEGGMNLASLPPACMSAVSAYAGASYLWSFIRMRGDRTSLFFALSCFSIALYDAFCAGLYGAAGVGQGMTWQRLQFASLGVFSICFAWFVHHYVRSGRTTIFAGYTLFMAAWVIAGLLVRGDMTLSASESIAREVFFFGSAVSVVYNEARPGPLYMVQYGAMFLVSLYLIWIAFNLYLDTRDRNTLALLVAFALFYLASVNDICVGMGIYPFFYVAEYAFMCVIVSMAFVMQNRFIDLHREVGELNEVLDRKVTDRTIELYVSEIGNVLYSDLLRGRKEEARDDGDRNSLESLSKDLAIIANLDIMLAKALAKAVEMTSSSTGFLFMADRRGSLVMRASIPEEGGSMSHELRELLRGEVLRHGGRLSVKRFRNSRGIAVPVVLDGMTIGACCLEKETVAYAPSEVRMVRSFIDRVTVLLENAFLYQRMANSVRATTRMSVSREIEEKINGAIRYIDENYTYDISREGLASALNMHPDSLGRYFKLCTGRRMNDYINALRVVEAARRLRETDDSVITIAFAVGFESIPTFNRVFAQIMKQTPSAYRESNRQ